MKGKQPVTMHLESLYEQIKGKKIALMMNASVLDSDGTTLIDTIVNSQVVPIEFLFGMEHGVRGQLDAGTHVKSQIDTPTSLAVYSLYDYPKLRPPVELVQKVDAVVFCAQDVGVRHYTYTPWMMFLMDAAAKADTQVIVVDRPNPIGGTIVEGNRTQSPYFSIVGGFDYAYRHGMTIGELASMYRAHYCQTCKLTVIKMQNYKRAMWYDETQLHWIPPSPNIPTKETPIVYATLGLLQDTNLSLGIGTTTPFTVFGAPWLDGYKVADQLHDMRLEGVRFIARHFIPHYGIYEGQSLSGVGLLITDREKYRPMDAFFAILGLLNDEYAKTFRITRESAYDRRAGTEQLRKAWTDAAKRKQMQEDWKRQAVEFLEWRKPHLLYE